MNGLNACLNLISKIKIFSADDSTIIGDNISLDKLEYVIDPKVSCDN